MKDIIEITFWLITSFQPMNLHPSPMQTGIWTETTMIRKNSNHNERI